MLILYMMHQQQNWEEYLSLVEFAYNNGYQESLKMSLFEALCGWSCSTPISCIDPMNRVLVEPYMLADMEQEMRVIKKNLNATEDRKKSHADRNSIVERIGSVTYRLAIPLTVKFHDVFQVSFLKKFVEYVDHVIDWFVLQAELDGEFQPEPHWIL
eukprot:PITA_23404